MAENRKPILNGNPSVEPGYLNDPAKFSTLRAAVAVPLEGVTGCLGVMTLYHAERDAFLRSVLTTPNEIIIVSNEVGTSLVPENAVARLFRDEQGRLNQLVAAACDAVFLVPAGRNII